MMNPQMVMYEEELAQLQALTDKLRHDSRSQTILLVDKNGQMIVTSGGSTDLDTTSLSSLVAGNVAATGGIAQVIREDEFTGQFHEGKDISVHMTLVAGRIILVVLFGKDTTHGLVRLRVRKATSELTAVFEALERKAATQSPQQNVFAEITDDDIDNLFND